MNLMDLNASKANVGLPPIQHVWCRICRQLDQHWWWNCPHIKCKICNENHATFTCTYCHACQWCGSVKHTSNTCDDANGRILKASTRRRCYRCGRFGHIASRCSSPAKRRRFKRFRRRFRRKRRR